MHIPKGDAQWLLVELSLYYSVRWGKGSLLCKWMTSRSLSNHTLW